MPPNRLVDEYGSQLWLNAPRKPQFRVSCCCVSGLPLQPRPAAPASPPPAALQLPGLAPEKIESVTTPMANLVPLYMLKDDGSGELVPRGYFDAPSAQDASSLMSSPAPVGMFLMFKATITAPPYLSSG